MARAQRGALRWRAIGALLLATLGLQPLLAAAPQPSLSDAEAAALFARLPEYETALLSPGGRWLAVAMLRDGFRAVAIVDLQTLEPRHVVRFDPPNEAERFYWAGDDRLLVTLATRVGRLEMPILTGALYAVNADGSDGRVIFDGVVERSPVVLAHGDAQRGELPVIVPGPRRRSHVLGFVPPPAGAPPGQPRKVLLGTQVPGPDGARVTEAFRLDTLDGSLQRDVRAPAPDAALVADESAEVRIAATRDRGLQLQVFMRTPGGEWTPRMQRAWGEGDWLPVAFDGPERVLVLENVAADRLGATLLDLRDGRTETLHRDARVDIDAVLATAPGERPYALRLQPARATYVTFAGATPARRLFGQALAAFPDQDIELTSITRDGSRAIVRVRADRDPGSLHLLRDGQRPELLLRARSWLPPTRLVPTDVLEATADDGTRLQLFVNRPEVNPEAAVPLPPIVLLPHGGPYGARDTWLFDELPQMLAARGYLALRVNFRGSAGYGRAFAEAAEGQWDGAMLDDLQAGLAHVVGLGWGDGARVAILGESYGAYAALMSAVRWPARFRCVVGSAGVYDLGLLYERGDLRRSTRGRALLKDMLGTDVAALRARSPLAHAAELRLPVLLVHGARDTRVPPEHARRMRDALVAAGHPAEYLELAGEGHGFVAAVSRERYYARVLTFLARHLQSQPSQAASATPLPPAGRAPSP